MHLHAYWYWKCLLLRCKSVSFEESYIGVDDQRSFHSGTSMKPLRSYHTCYILNTSTLYDTLPNFDVDDDLDLNDERTKSEDKRSNC